MTLKDIFLVIEQKEIMGYLVACLCDLGLSAEILRIAVHPDHRGKGIAKDLRGDEIPWNLVDALCSESWHTYPSCWWISD